MPKRILSYPTDVSAPGSATLVAIAKNESRYILEWLAHHLAVGFSKIIVYDDASTDGTLAILRNVSRVMPVISIRTTAAVDLHASPQTTSYNHALKGIDTEWTMFLDIDEFLVPFRDYSIGAFLMRAPKDVSSIHFNWRSFGSNGRTDANYVLVVEAFTRCAPERWSNHHHFKSIARTALIEKVHIHNVDMIAGRRVLSDLNEFETSSNGMSDRIVYDGIQINHYQSKTYEEFRVRMGNGDANYHLNHPLRLRDTSYERFLQIDRNEEENFEVFVFRARFERFYDVVGRASRQALIS